MFKRYPQGGHSSRIPPQPQEEECVETVAPPRMRRRRRLHRLGYQVKKIREDLKFQQNLLWGILFMVAMLLVLTIRK